MSGESKMVKESEDYQTKLFSGDYLCEVWKFIRFCNNLLTHFQESSWGPLNVCGLDETTQEFRDFFKALLKYLSDHQIKDFLILSHNKAFKDNARICKDWIREDISIDEKRKNSYVVEFEVFSGRKETDTLVALKSWNLLSSVKLLRSTLLVIQDCSEYELCFPIKDFYSFLMITCFNWTCLEFVGNAKYFTAYPLPKFLGDELPAKPSGFVCKDLIFEGKIGQYLRSRLRKQTTRKGHEMCHNLWFSFLQGIKRGCHTVPDIFIKSAYKKHSIAMEKNGDVMDEEMSKLFADSAVEFSKNFRFSKMKLYQPSRSAHFESSFMEKGALGHIKRQLIELEPFTNDEELKESLLRIEKTFVKVMDNTGDNISIEAIQILDTQDVGKIRDILREKYYIYDQNIDPMDWTEEVALSVETYAICEPLKVRMITKGESLPYWYAKHLQKEMWGYLKRFPQFSLTSEPLNVTHLQNMIQRQKLLEKRTGIFLGFDKLVSGDYSAATDNLKSCYTKIAFESLLSRISNKYLPKKVDADNLRFDLNVFRAVLYNSIVFYPKNSGVNPVFQRNGQLMGSPLSFPILCMVNLLAYKLSMEEYMEEKLTFEELPVLVNGDDILFPTNYSHYEIWKKWITEVGFELSIGKNYIHDEFLSINSQGFRYDYITETFSQISYLNTGLLTGQSKLSERSALDMLPIGDWYNKVLSNCVNQRVAHNLFLFYHQERIAKLTFNGMLNLFISKQLGGMGFINYANIDVKYTDFQLKMASFLHDKLNNFYGNRRQLNNLYCMKMVSSMVPELILQSNKKFKTMLYHNEHVLTEEERSLISKFEIDQLNPSTEFLLWNHVGLWEDLSELDCDVLVPKYNYNLIRSVHESDSIPINKNLDLSKEYKILLVPKQTEYLYNPNTFDIVKNTKGKTWYEDLWTDQNQEEEETEDDSYWDFTYDYQNLKENFKYLLEMGFNFEDYMQGVRILGAERFLNPNNVSIILKE